MNVGLSCGQEPLDGGAGWTAPIYPWGAWLLEKRGEGENAREADGPKDTIGEPT